MKKEGLYTLFGTLSFTTQRRFPDLLFLGQEILDPQLVKPLLYPQLLIHASVSHVPVYLVIVNHLSFDVPLSRDCIEFQTTFFTLPGRARFAH